LPPSTAANIDIIMEYSTTAMDLRRREKGKEQDGGEMVQGGRRLVEQRVLTEQPRAATRKYFCTADH
jgi:hypothetical protein